MSNKEFRVRHGIVVGNNVLVANVTTNTVTVLGTVNATGIQVNGTTIPSGETSNLIFNTANAAFDKANTVNTFAYGVAVNAAAAFAAANNVAPQVTPAFNTANAAYTLANVAYNATNSVFGVANAAFNSANNVAPQVAPAFNTANAAYTIANAGYSLTNSTYAAVNSAFGVVNAAYTQSNSEVTRLSAAYVVANAAYGNANTLAVAANNYAGVMANSVNAYASATYVKLTAGQQTITGDLAVTGNLTFLGNSTVISSGQLTVGDSLIYLAANNYSGTDIVDIGFIANYGNTTGANVHTGLIRDATDKQYYLFSAYDREPANNTFVPGSNNMVNAVLVADLNTSNLTLGGANAIVWIKSSYDNSNGAFGVANAAFGHSNTTYGAVNSAFGVINAAYTLANSDSTRLSAAYVVSNSAYAQVNTLATSANAYAAAVGTSTNNYTSATYSTLTQLGQNWAVTNAAFGVANSALPKAGGTMTGKPTISIDDASMAIAGSHLTLNSPTLSQMSLGFSFGGVGKASIRIDNGGSFVMNSMANTYFFGYDVVGGGTTTSNFYNSGTRFMYVSGSNVYIPTDVRTPIVYDSDNTGYYVNPASTSNFNALNVISLVVGQGQTSSTITMYDSDNGNRYIHANSDRLGFLNLDASGWWAWNDNAGNWFTASSSRAPLFYDYNDTTYYVDPASWCYITGMSIKNNPGSRTPLSVYQYGGTSASPTECADWPYPVLSLRGYGDFYLQTMISFGLPGDADYQANDNIWNFKLNGVNANGWDNNGNLTPKTSTDSTVGLQLLGPGNLRIGSVNAKNVYIRTNNSDRVTVDSSGNMTVTGYVYAPGSVVQVVSTSLAGTFTSSAVAWTDVTSLTATITPKSASSKILAIFTSSVGSSASNANYGVSLRLVRGATVVGVGNKRGSELQSSTGAVGSLQNYCWPVTFNFLDSPATTSSTTYKVQMYFESTSFTGILGGSWNTGNANYNSSNPTTLTLMEIAQ